MHCMHLPNGSITYVCLSFLLGLCVCSRETGALNRIIDRGSRAINFILSSMVFNIVPTILEVCMFCQVIYLFIIFWWETEMYSFFF